VDPERAAALRNEMVRDQLVGRGIRDERLLAAMGRVPRELFVAPQVVDRAYRDEALPIDSGQTISQPYMVAWMTELLDARPGMCVLEIGTGSGYQAAVLAAMGCDVITIERHASLADAARERIAGLASVVAAGASGEGGAGVAGGASVAGAGGSRAADLAAAAARIRVVTGDGSVGLPEAAPFERIIVTAAAPEVPTALRDQLADGGRLVVPVGPRRLQRLILVVRHGNDFEATDTGSCVFVPLVGRGGFAGGRADGNGDPEPVDRFRWFRRRNL
jgi:protein-L-isoaspartate(D-aspartate) O-methyltransferase